MKPFYQRENITLHLGDCREVLQKMGGGKVELVLTDPPYGIGKDGQKPSTGAHGGRKAYEFKGWDSEVPSQEVFDLILAAGEKHIIWGGNYFADMLPAAQKWLVWDKGQRINQSDGELAYTSMQGALRIKTMNRVELMKDGAVHPTQKPVNLMIWCINEAGTPQSILDPFCGSGSTGVAAIRLGRSFVGIEREEAYAEICAKRFERELAQGRLFEPQAVTAPPLQMSLVA